jgi:hypothetical protein
VFLPCNPKFRRLTGLGLASFAWVFLLLIPALAQAAGKPFDTMSGSWSGNGVITLGSGDKERIRCRAVYIINDDGGHVQQDLRCASDSYKFEMINELYYADGKVTGRWDEKTRRTGGVINGRASPGRIEALAETGGFAAFFTMTTRGDQQSVKIESKSPDISDVSITLRRTSR